MKSIIYQVRYHGGGILTIIGAFQTIWAGIALAVTIGLGILVGIITLLIPDAQVWGDTINYWVGGRSILMWMAGTSMGGILVGLALVRLGNIISTEDE